MNALTVAKMFWILFVDETGPCGSELIHGNWSHLDNATVLQLVKTAHPSRTILSVDWAAKEQRIMGDATLLVRIPGTHEVKTAPKRARKPRAKAVSDFIETRSAAELEEDARYDAINRSRWSNMTSTAPARAPSVEAGPACNCGIKHTMGSFRALPLVSAVDHVEKFTTVHDERRICACGQTLHITTKRLLGDKR